jgi:hypothetical protein
LWAVGGTASAASAVAGSDDVVHGTEMVLTASPPTAAVGVPVTLTATVSPAIAGSVDFTDGATDLGSAPVTTGLPADPGQEGPASVAMMTHTFTALGTENLTATFTPTDTADYGGSVGSLSLTVNPVATPTVTALAISQAYIPGDVAVSATVVEGPGAPGPGSPVDAGAINFFSDYFSVPMNSTPVPLNADGTATFEAPLTYGGWVYAVFVPADVTQFESSQSPYLQYLNDSGPCADFAGGCPDEQNIEATVPVGTLTISTPYTAANPLNLGNLELNSGLTEYTGTGSLSGITVVDTRAGDLPWTITALASNLTDGGSNRGSVICAQNIGLTGLASTPGSGFTGTVTTTDNPAAGTDGIPVVAPTAAGCPSTAGGLAGAGGIAVTVATATQGLGTDSLTGTITLDAPTSTEAGLYTGTITFTVG